MQLSLGLNTHQLFLQEHAGLALQYFLGVQAETALYSLLVSLYHVHVNSTELTNLPGAESTQLCLTFYMYIIALGMQLSNSIYKSLQV